MNEFFPQKNENHYGTISKEMNHRLHALINSDIRYSFRGGK